MNHRQDQQIGPKRSIAKIGESGLIQCIYQFVLLAACSTALCVLTENIMDYKLNFLIYLLIFAVILLLLTLSFRNRKKISVPQPRYHLYCHEILRSCMTTIHVYVCIIKLLLPTIYSMYKVQNCQNAIDSLHCNFVCILTVKYR